MDHHVHVTVGIDYGLLALVLHILAKDETALADLTTRLHASAERLKAAVASQPPPQP